VKAKLDRVMPNVACELFVGARPLLRLEPDDTSPNRTAVRWSNLLVGYLPETVAAQTADELRARRWPKVTVTELSTDAAEVEVDIELK